MPKIAPNLPKPRGVHLKFPTKKTGKSFLSFFKKFALAVCVLAILVIPGFEAIKFRNSFSSNAASSFGSPPPDFLSNDSLSEGSISSPSPYDTPLATLAPLPTDDQVSYAPPTITIDPVPSTPAAISTASEPDPAHCSISATSAPADGSSQSIVTVTIENSSGQPLGGQNVSLSTLQGDINFYPTSKSTDSSGHATFTATSYSSTPELVNATVSGSLLSDIGTITFNSLGTSSSTTTNSSPSCTAIGVPTAYNSEVYDPSGSVTVGDSGSVTVDLLDCNNTKTSVSDTLTIVQVSGSSGLEINGSSLPISLETQNGEVIFSVTASLAGTYSFKIEDTTHGFSVTTPTNGTPTVTFTGSSSTPPPTSTPTPSSTPSPSPTPTPTPTPAPSPS